MLPHSLGWKQNEAVLNQLRLSFPQAVMLLPCPVPAASCGVGLCRAPLHQQPSGTCCVVLTRAHFPTSSGAGPGELLNQPQPAPLPKGPCGCARSQHGAGHNPGLIIPPEIQQHPHRGATGPKPPLCRAAPAPEESESPSFWPFPRPALVLPSLLPAGSPGLPLPGSTSGCSCVFTPPEPKSPRQQGISWSGDNPLLGESVLLELGKQQADPRNPSTDTSPREENSPRQSQGNPKAIPWSPVFCHTFVGAAPAGAAPGRACPREMELKAALT